MKLVNSALIPDRWEKILEMVAERGEASVDDISQSLGISFPTARRDLAQLSDRGLISRTRGGAAPAPGVRVGSTLAESRRVNPAEKELIGRAAARMIEPGDCVMIDGGFTTYQVARHITARDVTVITNSLDVANALAGRPAIMLVVLGGELLAVSGTTVGPATERQALEMVADKAFLGANAISVRDGLCSDNQLTTATKRAMIERSKRVIVVADYSKLGGSALYRVAPIERINSVISDDRADPNEVEQLREAGVDVLVAASNRGTEQLEPTT